MADDEVNEIFDPSLKKKKKKKKTGFDIDAALAGESGMVESNTAPEEEAAVEDEPQPASEKVDDIGLDDDLLNFSKKKKKKKKAFGLSELDDALPSATEEKQDDAFEDANINEESMDFSLPTKKKKKKKVKIAEGEEGVLDEDEIDGEQKSRKSEWADTDRDYTYDELLKRVFDIMREKNPDMIAGEKRRFVMKPPQVMRVGTKKSSFSNFAEICKMLHRQPKHLLAFLLAELGTSGSVDGNNQLIIKGRFQQKQIENVLRKYIKEYVTCHTCRSPDTILQKDTRLFFLQCETCGSRCSVASIKSGFQAVTGKRAAIRAKTA